RPSAGHAADRAPRRGGVGRGAPPPRPAAAPRRPRCAGRRALPPSYSNINSSRCPFVCCCVRMYRGGLTMSAARSGGQPVGQRSGSRTLGGMATAAALCDLGPREFLGEIDVLLSIYADAMDADAALLPGRRELMRRHAGYPEFKGLQARSSNGGPCAAAAPRFHV